MIDVSVTGSPGWHLARNAKLLTARRPQLDLLASYADGNPPLPPAARGLSAQFQDFLTLARANYAELVSESVADRTTLLGFRTGATGDEDGDAKAQEVMAAGMDVESAEAHRLMFNLGTSYMIVGDLDDETEMPVVTAEDPRQVITVHDPRIQRRVVSASKIYHDDDRNEDRAYTYLPNPTGAKVYVAYREGRGSTSRIAPQSWTWDEDLGGAEGQTLPFSQVPVVRYRNKDGKGEFETHLKHLDRINFWLFQCMIIAIHQAHRQRAARGDLPDADPLTGELIDYDEVFRSDPGALWKLPEGVEIWESQQTDLTGVAALIDKDVQRLAAVTRTPLFYLTADATNGSAEGASLSRESLVFKARDRITRLKQAHRSTMSLAFLWLGDTDRAKYSALEAIMAPPEQFSLAERADAGTKAVAGGVPWATTMTDVWQFSPADVRRMRAERLADSLLTATQQVFPAPVPAVA